MCPLWEFQHFYVMDSGWNVLSDFDITVIFYIFLVLTAGSTSVLVHFQYLHGTYKELKIRVLSALTYG